MKEFPEKVQTDRIWKYVSPLLIILGTVGNILAITVLSRRRSRNNSTAIFLCALGVSDIILLNTELLREWMLAVFDFDIRTSGNAVCKIHIFFVYLSCHCSSWFLVAVTCERFLGVWFPHKVKHKCTPKTSFIVIAVIVGILVLLNFNMFISMEIIEIKIDNETSIFTCDVSHEYSVIWHSIHLCVFCLLPFTILLICNCSVIIRLVKRTRQRRSKKAVEDSKNDKTTQVTTLLVLLNIVFFINTLPISIFLVIDPDMADSSDHDQAKLQLYYAIVNMFVFLNSAINFVLYFLTGSRFRADIKALFCRKQCFEFCITTNSKDISLSQTTTRSQPESSAMDTSSDI